jgi:multiple sugar transport system permease protein
MARRAILNLVLAASSLVMALPLIWVVANSFKPEREIFTIPPSLVPYPPTLANYQKAFALVPIVTAYVNTIEIAALVTLGTLFTASIAAYAFARLQFAGRDALFLLVLATLMIPFQVTLIPSYLLFHQLGWLDTHWPLIAPPALTNGFAVFLLRQFLLTVPIEYEDAARIDGANPFQIYWRVTLPLVQPALGAVAILAFLASWNSYLQPLVYLTSTKNYTLQLIISSFKGIYNVEFGAILATTSLALVPLLAVYFAGQRLFIEGLSFGGLKG